MIPLIKNFRKVIETKDIGRMNKELYEFLTLYCGFVAHYNIEGFKAAYRNPRDFAEVFIRHFDRDHRYYNRVCACHEFPYKDTGVTKAEIKREFGKIVECHKLEIGQWAIEEQQKDRYILYLKLKEEFEGGERNDRRV